MRNIFLFIAILLGCSIIALWSPWLNANISISAIFGVEEPDEIASLQVFSLSGDIDVYIDGNLQGTAKQSENESLIVDKVEPGDRLVRLIRQSNISNAYWEFSELVYFEVGKDVVISYNLGTEMQYSEGHIIYTKKSTEIIDDRTTINIETDINDAQLTLDTTSYTIVGGKLTEIINLNKQYRVAFSQLGYEPIEFTILPAAQEDRDKFEGYEIYLDVRLMEQPIQID